jgi:competence protein ComEC
MWAGMLQAALGQVAGLPLAGPVAGVAVTALAHPAEAGLRYIAWVARSFADASGAALEAPLGSPVEALGAYAFLGVLVLAGRATLRRARGRRAEALSALGRSSRGERAAVLVALVALVALGLHLWLGPGLPPDRLAVSFLDVGQGDATLVQHPDGSAILFDGGPPEGRVPGMLRRAGVRRLSLVVATHASRDHHGGLEEVLESYPVELLLDGGDGTRHPAYRRLLAAADRRGVPHVAAVAGQRLRAGGLTVRVLGPAPRAPGPPPEDPNPRAVAAVVSAGAFDLFLSGDAESDALASLPLVDVEALKVSHHGSADSGLPALLRRLRPEVAVIQVGAGNPYGHPAADTVAALGAAVPRVLRTDRDGTVRLEVADGGLEIVAGR